MGGGKKKKNSKGDGDGQRVGRNPLPAELVSMLGQTLATASMVATPSLQGETNEHKIWMTPESMHAARIATGQNVLISSNDSSGPQSAWDNLSAAARLTIRPPVTDALGCIALAVTAWPHAGLTAKTAALSPSAVEQLGLLGLFPTGGPRGAVLHVHAVPHSCAAATSLELTPVEVALQEDGGDDGLTQQQQQPDRNDYDRDDDRDDDNALVLVLVQPPPPGSAAAGSAGPFSHGNRNTALLRMSRGGHTPPTATPTPARVVSQPTNTPAVDWLVKTLYTSGTPASSVMTQLLKCHLVGRTAYPGALVLLPVLGQRLALQVTAYHTSPPPTMTTPTTTPPLVQITPDTVIHLHPPRAATDGGHDDSSSIPRHAPGRDALIQRAKRAAADAVGGGLDGAAATSAANALSAGIAHTACTAQHDPFANIAGMTTQVKLIQRTVVKPLVNPALTKGMGLTRPCGVLLHGPPGTGKSMLCRAIAQAAGAHVFVVNGPDVLTGLLGDSEAGIRGIFAAAASLQPSIILLEELDALAPHKRDAAGGAQGTMQRVVTTLLGAMDAVQGPTAVMATTNRVDSVDASLRRPGRLDREVEIPVPGAEERHAILRLHLSGLHHTLTGNDIEAAAARAHGFVGADVHALASEAALCALRRIVGLGGDNTAGDAMGSDKGGSKGALSVTVHDLRKAETVIRPSALREVSVEVPHVTWDDVGGMDHVKQQLQEVVTWPQQHPDALRRLGVEAPRGVLLYGPPGCSKTLLARAVAGECGLNFLSVKGPELLSKYVGESERAVMHLFARARAVAPSVVFFDELDGLAGVRDTDGTTTAAGEGASVSQRVISQLLVEMDGLQGRGQVVVLAATNRPDCVDPALLRPGRFDRLVHVPPPDAAARLQILQVHTRRTPLLHDVALQAVAEATDNFSGADIMALCRVAALAALQEDMEAPGVGARHFDAALLSVHSSLL